MPNPERRLEWENYAQVPFPANMAAGEIFYTDLIDGYLRATVKNGQIKVWPQIPEGDLSGEAEEYLTAVAHGARALDLAARNKVSIWTVLRHLKNARHRLGARTTPHAVRIGIRVGVIPYVDISLVQRRNADMLSPLHIDALLLASCGLGASQAAWLRYRGIATEKTLRSNAKRWLHAKYISHAVGIATTLNLFGDDLDDFDIPTLPASSSAPGYYIDP